MGYDRHRTDKILVEFLVALLSLFVREQVEGSPVLRQCSQFLPHMQNGFESALKRLSGIFIH